MLALCPALAARAQSPLPLDAFAPGLEARAPGIRPGAPRLVVAFLFDQWRGDLVERYRPAFGKDGFVRVMDGGARFTDCTIPYAITFTGPGHATWLSGAPPSVHGIVDNGWYDRALGMEPVAQLNRAGSPERICARLIGQTPHGNHTAAKVPQQGLELTSGPPFVRVVALPDRGHQVRRYPVGRADLSQESDVSG